MLTLSVRSFHTPETPLIRACPPSLPSVPTSRATRVTSSANERSWSTIVLMVSFSWSTSPRTSTVIFRDRSPSATAVVTSAMFRTWSVRFEAIELTESVRSRQVPETPFTFAWPPSLPSVPTSRATRVTSPAKDERRSTIRFTVPRMRRNSPFTGRPSMRSAIFWERSPLATASITRANSVVGRTRSSIRALSASTLVFQPPASRGAAARSVMRPSRPTTRRTREISRAICALDSTSALKAAASSWAAPLPAGRIRTEKSPPAAASMALRREAISASVRPPRPLTRDAADVRSLGRDARFVTARTAIPHPFRSPTTTTPKRQSFPFRPES